MDDSLVLRLQILSNELNIVIQARVLMLEVRSKLTDGFCELCDCVIDEIVLTVTLVIYGLGLFIAVQGEYLFSGQFFEVLLVWAEQFAMKVALKFLGKVRAGHRIEQTLNQLQHLQFHRNLYDLMQENEPLHRNKHTLPIRKPRLSLQPMPDIHPPSFLNHPQILNHLHHPSRLKLQPILIPILQPPNLPLKPCIHFLSKSSYKQQRWSWLIKTKYNISQRQIIDMLKQNIKGKRIAILGYQTLVGRTIMKKILEGCENGEKVIAIEVGKDQVRRGKVIEDGYFSQKERKGLMERVEFVPLAGLEERVKMLPNQRIDILFSLFQPLDFSNFQQVVEYHLIKTSRIVQTLHRIQITKIIHLSSIYVRQPGYLSQQDQIDTTQFRQTFTKKQDATAYMNDNFDSQIQGWRWTIGFVERSYSKVCKSIVILRVPSLGPTITHFQGYSLKFNYFTYLIYQMGTGLIKNIDGLKKNKVDIVPTDYVANLMIVLSVRSTNLRAETVNLSTSTRNYITLQQFIEYCQEAWREYGTKTPKVTVTQSALGRKIKHTTQLLPSQAKKRIGTFFDIISWKIEGNRAHHQIQQKIDIINKYKYFLSQQWHCESIKSIDIFNQLSPQEQVMFDFNINAINWRTYVRLCVYSIKKHLLNENVEQFKPQTLNLLSPKNYPYFSDIMWALREGKSAKGQSSQDAIEFVLNSKAVKDAIKMLVEEKMMKLEGPSITYEKAEEQLKKAAEEMCTQMFSDYSMGSLRMFAWFLHKVFGAIYEKVVIDKAGLTKLQSHNEETQGPLIIIPTHRSYIDFLIMSYVFFGNGIKCPHIAAAEDFLNMAVIHILLRKSGAFFIKRNQKKYRELYKAIMNEYIAKLLSSNHYLEFFIEGTRSRTGKMLAPKYGMLSLVAKNVAEGRAIDAHILPVTINYERVLEGNSFTYEMMGEAKVKESLSRLVKAVDVLKENYGRIYLELCETISVKEWLHTQQGNFTEKMEKLGNKIVYQLSNKLVVTGPAIVSSVVLMSRKGISDDSLQEKTSWLCKEISSRGIKIARSQADSSISVNSTLSLLEGILQKSKKDMFQVQVSFDQNSFVKLFTLTYYRNTLAHIFFQEAVVATALASFGHHRIITKSITVDQLYKQSCLLAALLENQFYLSTPPISNQERYNEVLRILSSKNIIKIEEDYVLGMDLTGNYFNFYWSLVWPVVESYWITCLYLFKLLKNNVASPAPKFMSEIQWFGQSLLNERIITHLESISSDTIKNAVAIFTKMKIILNIKQGEQSLVKIGVEEPILRATLEKIEPFLKSYYAKSLKGILGSNQGSVNIDFPFLSKL